MDTIGDILQAFQLNIVSTIPARWSIKALVERQLTNVAASKDNVSDVVKAVKLGLLDATLAQNYTDELLLNRYPEAVAPSETSVIGDTPVGLEDNEPKQTPATSQNDSSDATPQLTSMKSYYGQTFSPPSFGAKATFGSSVSLGGSGLDGGHFTDKAAGMQSFASLIQQNSQQRPQTSCPPRGCEN
eukprot:Em0013g222a